MKQIKLRANAVAMHEHEVRQEKVLLLEAPDC